MICIAVGLVSFCVCVMWRDFTVSAVSEDVVEEINEVKGHYNLERQERQRAEGEVKEVRITKNEPKTREQLTLQLPPAFVPIICHNPSEL